MTEYRQVLTLVEEIEAGRSREGFTECRDRVDALKKK